MKLAVYSTKQSTTKSICNMLTRLTGSILNFFDFLLTEKPLKRRTAVKTRIFVNDDGSRPVLKS